MDALLTGTLNVTNIAECILELVLNSLNANATSIAIRIHAESRKIQVVDNGVGISKKTLKVIAENNNQVSYNYWNIQDICNLKGQTILNIRKLSDAMLITSRHCSSSKTYMKIFKVCHNSKIVKIQRRPSHGTTITIHGFHELSLNKWNIRLMYHIIANVAMVNSQVSFTIRDDQEKRVIMAITKPHNPIDIFKSLYNKQVIFQNTWYIQNTEECDPKFCIYIGLTNVKSNITQCVFINNKLVHCPLILEVTKAIFINEFRYFAKVHYGQMLTRKAIFILIFIKCTDYIFAMENGRKTLLLPNIQELLQNIKQEVLNIFTKNIAPLSNNVSRYVRKHRNLIYSRTSNFTNISLFKNTLISQLSVSQKGHKLHIYSIKREVTKLTISQSQKSIDNKESVSKVNSITMNSFNTEENLSQNRDNKTQLFTPVSQNNNVDKEIVALTLSEWSNWSHPDNKPHNFLQIYKHFDFLPKKLHKQLRGNVKLTKTDVLNKLGENISSEKLKFGLQIPDILLHQEIDIRPCKVIECKREFRLKKEFLQHLKILGQMNNELIVGLINQNNMKVLLLMDQHAAHERIRYENLLQKYKSQTRHCLSFIKLKDPIALELPTDKCNLLASNKVTLKKFGITFNTMNDNTIMVYTVPQCLKKNKYDEYKLKLDIETLLNEILQNIATYGSYGTNNLPITIHNAIAMEACRGAIKFGDPLTLKECKQLLKLLNRTKIPTRCAHGRPSIIPLLELTELEKRHKKIIQVCCNHIYHHVN